MSDASTTALIEMYAETAQRPSFLAGSFVSPPQNSHTTEDVEVDIVRDSEDVATVITDLTAGPRFNEASIYTNKRFTPPIYDEAGAITAFDLMKRQPGQNPYMSPDYAANATRSAFQFFRKIEDKIRRAIELQCSQVLQTGKLTLKDKAGTSLYTLDFQPKAAHFPTVTTWATNGSTGTPLIDLANLADLIRVNGKREPKKLIFGDSAWQRYLANADVVKSLDVLRLGTGQVAPESRGQGGTFQGWFWIGSHYRLEAWTYAGGYKDPATGNHVPYVDPTKVIMLSDGRLDLTFGAIPLLAAPDPRALPFLPPRISSEGRGLDLSVNAYLSQDNKQVVVTAGTRPLTIPTAIDSFGALKVAA